jgi:succinate dehydrogenase/fumarate reductase flavoprotein subunit
MNVNIEVVSMDTDVLVVGGGLAGCMAGIKASEYGVKVTIVEKANTLASGCAATGIDHTWAYIPPIHQKMGWTIEDLMEDHTQGKAGGFLNKELLYLIASENYNRVLDLEKFGINFRYEDSKIPGRFRIVHQFHSMPTSFNFDGRPLKVKLTQEAKKRGVAIINRVMVTDLLSTDGQISGALGVSTRDNKLYFLKAKTIVLSTGRINRLSRIVSGVWGNYRMPNNETGDGRSMAIRAGAGVINMEFLSPSHFMIGNYEISFGIPRNEVQPCGSVTGPKGEVIAPRTYFYDWENLGKEKVDAAEARRTWLRQNLIDFPPFGEMYKQGKGPFYLDLTGGTEEEIKYVEWSVSNEGQGYRFLNYLKTQEGFDFRKDKIEILPNSREMAGTAASGLLVNKDLETDVKGLFAAGDEVGGVPWQASAGAFSMGWHAGEMAAQKAKKEKGFLPVSDEKLEPLKRLCSNILNSKEGLHWREVELAVQNIMDYYAGDVRAEEMLKRGIDRLNDIKGNVSFRAENTHELARCLEVRSVVDNADIVLRASLGRKETRKFPFGFCRADFPEQDDKNWLNFLTLKIEDGKYKYLKIPIK